MEQAMDKLVALKDIVDFLGSDVITVYGATEGVYVNNLKPAASVDEKTLDWINVTKDEKQLLAEKSNARVIVVDEDIHYSKMLQSQKKVLLVVADPKLCILKIGNNYFVKKPKPGIHPTAAIHPKAIIGRDLYAGAYVSIGRCIIGDNVVIHPHAVIHDEVIIGNRVTIKPGAILGFDGFGYERDHNNNWVKFPQLGKLIIHDNVEIGANCCIDKGSLSDTIIGYNSKINNLCHIAHNVLIGRNVIITGHVNISGSSVIEDNVWIAPNASLRGHQHIGAGATIGMGSVVTKDVPAGETWVGNPAKKVEK
jgi:UDP-3-O-[3-hydroxymyristoyl] glucosamine N-acyltransferase